MKLQLDSTTIATRALSTGNAPSAPGSEVTSSALREMLAGLSGDHERLEMIGALASQIRDKAGAAEVIAEEMYEDHNKATGIRALNESPESAPEAPTRVPIPSPSLGDRFGGVVRGLARPLEPVRLVQIGLGALVLGFLSNAIGIPLSQIPGINFLGHAAGIAGAGANILAAFTGLVGCSAFRGITSGWAEPTRSAADAAVTGANIGSAS